jgi:hypothetical protein
MTKVALRLGKTGHGFALYLLGGKWGAGALRRP